MKGTLEKKIDFSNSFSYKNNTYTYWSLNKAEEYFHMNFSSIPYSIRVFVESQLRLYGHGEISIDDLRKILLSLSNNNVRESFSFYPSRVLIQDYTGIPLLVDLATMREAVKEKGGNPDLVNPMVQTDIVVDHSIQVDLAGSIQALEYNTNKEYERNIERYKMLKWAESSFNNVRIFPPGSGIIHQINLEYLASLIKVNQDSLEIIPDSVIGTDSHTTMINSMGILGWGVGGIEAESVMLGNPLNLIIPDVVGIELVGKLRPGITITDFVLTLTEKLREIGVVNKFVEFFGSGLKNLNLEERATIANMAPEYGATCAYFPVEEECFSYFNKTGRSDEIIALSQEYYTSQGLLYKNENPIPDYNSRYKINLNEVTTSLSGPKRPQDRVNIECLKSSFGQYLEETQKDETQKIVKEIVPSKLTHGSILIAAITSCTNTSNPMVMIGAGLLAKNAFNRGLSIPSYVKTSFSPGSKVVSDYLDSAKLTPYLNNMGFQVTGYGCMTCSGSSGTLDSQLENEIQENNLVVASILSGNRNFEGRIHKAIKANYLASPPLVIAYAIAGRIDTDLLTEPLGHDHKGVPVFLEDIWPSDDEIEEVIVETINPNLYKKRYENQAYLDQKWKSISHAVDSLYQWDNNCTYIRKPSYFNESINSHLLSVNNGRVLVLLEDSITTDHISPGGEIAVNSPAGKYLLDRGVKKHYFNTYGSRRGNHEVMMRGTFANVRLRNQLLLNHEGGDTIHFPSKKMMTIYDAAVEYSHDHTPLIVLAGKEYGSGSSRDWAAKGTALLGVRVVMAESFERIHRSNLINMGILPVQFEQGESWRSIGLNGTEEYCFDIPKNLLSQNKILIKAKKTNGEHVKFNVTSCIDTEEEFECYKDGGILHHVVKKMTEK